MTDTSNQNPVQSPSDNPFFRPVTNDPAPITTTLAPDPLTTPQSPPAPATTMADPLTTTQPTTMQTDTNAAVSQSLPNSINDNLSIPAVADTMPSPVVADTSLPVETPVQPDMPTSEAMPSIGMNTVSTPEAPVAQPVDPVFTVPAIPEMAATLPTETNTSEVISTESLPGSTPVIPPQLTPEVGASIAPGIDSPVTLSPMEPAVNNVTEEPKATLPDLNSLNTTPELTGEVKPIEASMTSASNQVGSLPEIPNMNTTMTESLPSMDTLAQDTSMPVEKPVLETPAVVTADPVVMQPEPAPAVEVAPTLPPLEPVVQPVETPVVAPIAQEVPPVATEETKETKTETAPVNETVPAPAGKMKNLVLLLGVLVVGIIALVLGIIVASTQ